MVVKIASSNWAPMTDLFCSKLTPTIMGNTNARIDSDDLEKVGSLYREYDEIKGGNRRISVKVNKLVLLKCVGKNQQ